MSYELNTSDRGSLQMDGETTVFDVLDFVEERIADPVVMDDVVVFNFHNSSLKVQPFLEWAEDAEPGVYVVPYAIPAVWAFMVQEMPTKIRKARPMVYRSNSNEYDDYVNFEQKFKDELMQSTRWEQRKRIWFAIPDEAKEVMKDAI